MKKLATATLLSFGLLMSMTASAGDANVDRAQALFDEAKIYFENESYAAACPKFEESKRLAPGLGVTLYLAACDDAIGKRASALAHYREAEAIAHIRGDAREEIAHRAVVDLEATTARIRVHLPKESAQAIVTDNGRAVNADPRGFPADPGSHKIVVSAAGKEEWHETVRVPESADDGSPSTIEVTMPAPGNGARVTGVVLHDAQPRTETVSSNAGSTQRAIGVGVGAAGLVGLGLGSYFGVHALSLRSESNDAGGGCNANDQCDAHGQLLRTSALESATLSTALFAAGGAAIVTGVVLYVSAPSNRTDVAVALGPNGAALRGTF